MLRDVDFISGLLENEIEEKSSYLETSLSEEEVDAFMYCSPRHFCSINLMVKDLLGLVKAMIESLLDGVEGEPLNQTHVGA